MNLNKYKIIYIVDGIRYTHYCWGSSEESLRREWVEYEMNGDLIDVILVKNS